MSHPPDRFLFMGWERDLSIDSVEQQLVDDYRLLARVHSRLIENLELLDKGQVFTSDGSRNLSEWLSARADIGLENARTLVQTMRRTQNKPWLREALAAGAITFDRVAALSRIPDDVGTLPHLDVAGVRRNAADRVEITAEEEQLSAADRFLVIQPSLDESWWKVFGGLDGLTGAAVDRVLTEKADAIPDLPDGSKGSNGWRKATALYELATGGSLPQAQITVFVDAAVATPSNAKAGVRLDAGPRVGARALQAILCDSVTEVTVNSIDGVPLKYGRRSRTIPPELRRAVLATNGGYCAIDGCNSHYRVEVHHIIPWSEGGVTDPENLLPLCWFHHHIAIHERDLKLFRHPDHGRWRLKPTTVYASSQPARGSGVKRKR